MAHKNICILALLGALSACGAGNTSSSSIAALAVRNCIELQPDTASSIVMNNCDYAVNIAELNGENQQQVESFLLQANSRRNIEQLFSNWGACRSPYVITEEHDFNYRCRKI